MEEQYKNFISYVDNCSWGEKYAGQCDWNSSLIYILFPIVIYALLIIAFIIILFCGCIFKSGWSIRKSFTTSITFITISGSIFLAVADGSMLHLIFEITNRISVMNLKFYKKFRQFFKYFFNELLKTAYIYNSIFLL